MLASVASWMCPKDGYDYKELVVGVIIVPGSTAMLIAAFGCAPSEL